MKKVLNYHRYAVASCVAVMALTIVISGSDTVQAQSGSRSGRKPAVRKQSGSGSANRIQSGSGTVSTKNGAAMEGYCPVCIIDMKKWVRGVPEHRVEYDGKTYFFPGAKQRQMFLANPAKYVPALNGDCAVCFINMEKRVPGNVRHAAYHNQRLFLFPNAELKDDFLANRGKFANADSVLNGNCSVCKIEMGKDVPGKLEFAAFHHGMRYLFPAEKQRQMFLANPTKYSVDPS